MKRTFQLNNIYGDVILARVVQGGPFHLPRYLPYVGLLFFHSFFRRVFTPFSIAPSGCPAHSEGFFFWNQQIAYFKKLLAQLTVSDSTLKTVTHGSSHLRNEYNTFSRSTTRVYRVLFLTNLRGVRGLWMSFFLITGSIPFLFSFMCYLYIIKVFPNYLKLCRYATFLECFMAW